MTSRTITDLNITIFTTCVIMMTFNIIGIIIITTFTFGYDKIGIAIDIEIEIERE